MKARPLTAIVGLGVIILIISLVIAPTITATTQNATTGLQLAEGETANVTSQIRMDMEKVGPTNATIRLQDQPTKFDITKELQENKTKTYALVGGDVTVTVEEISSNDVVLTSVDYPRTYGWSDGAKAFAEELDVLLAISAFLLVMGALIGVLYT